MSELHHKIASILAARDGGDAGHRPPPLETAVTIVSLIESERCPRCVERSDNTNLREMLKDMTHWQNHQHERIDQLSRRVHELEAK